MGDELICLGVQLQEVDVLDSRVHPNGAVAHGSLEGLGGSPFSIWELQFRPNNSVPNVFGNRTPVFRLHSYRSALEKTPALSRMVVRTSKGAPRMFIVGERHMTRRYDDGWRMVSRVTGR